MHNAFAFSMQGTWPHAYVHSLTHTHTHTLDHSYYYAWYVCSMWSYAATYEILREPPEAVPYRSFRKRVDDGVRHDTQLP